MSTKTELLGTLEEIWKSLEDIKYGYIELKVNYDERICIFDSRESLDIEDRDYDSGFGGQELFGTITFKDGTWLERGEYDGSEWWEYKTTPKGGGGGEEEVFADSHRCNTCKHLQDEVCTNDKSPHCADFVTDGCDRWNGLLIKEQISIHN